MEFFLYSFIHSINCKLTSETIPNVQIILNERRIDGLYGKLYKSKDKKIINFKTSKSNKTDYALWSYEIKNKVFAGEILLFKDNQLWNPHRQTFKPSKVNRVIFSGLASKLRKNINDMETIKASYGFFEIGEGCYGGRIKRV